MPRQIDLEPIDASRLVRGLQLFQTVPQSGNVRVLIANDLRCLQQADVAAGLLSTGATGEAESLIRLITTNTADAVQRISVATHQQQVATDQLASAMSDILRTTEASKGAQWKMSVAR